MAMAVVGFGVLFAGVVSSVLAGATTSLLLAFILPVSLAGPPSSMPDRLAGWGMAAAAAFVAVALLWPAPAQGPAARAGRRPPAGRWPRGCARMSRTCSAAWARRSTAEHERAMAGATAAVGALRRGFLATPYRPTGLSTAARTIVRLVDELSWLNAILMHSKPLTGSAGVDRAACAVKSAAAAVLERGADLLDARRGKPAGAALSAGRPARDADRAGTKRDR